MHSPLYWLLAAVGLSTLPQAEANSLPSSHVRWEQEIQAFEQQDKLSPPRLGAVLFTGSSSIRMWSHLAASFPGKPVFGRGFGGSHLSDLNAYAHRMVLPYSPRHVLIYEGDNDLAAGKSPEQILKDFEAFVGILRSVLPRTRISFIAIKPSKARWALTAQIRKTNDYIRSHASRNRGIDFIDIFTPMLSKSGQVREELFLEDGLHLNPQGYAVWTSVIRRYL